MATKWPFFDSYQTNTFLDSDVLCYDRVVVKNRDGLFENQEMNMTARTNNDIMHEIEGRHFGRCVDQMWGTGRRTLIELMEYQKAACQAVIVKQYAAPVPKSESSKPWPDLISAYVYVPVEDASNTWVGLDAGLTAYEEKTTK